MSSILGRHRHLPPVMSAPSALPSPARRQLLRHAAAWSVAAALPFVRHARAADVDRFPLGVASGQQRPGDVVLWTRLIGADLPERVPGQWEVAHDEAFERIAARGSEVADRASAHSVHAEAAGLAPSRWYWYRFTALGARSAAGRTRTAPAAYADEPLQFAIPSCQRRDHGHYAAWRHLADEGLDLVVFVGDYIYEGATPPAARRVRAHEGATARTLADYRARYAQYKSDPLLQRAHAAAPWLVVWDDHEVENDYAGLQSASLDPAFGLRRAAAYRRTGSTCRSRTRCGRAAPTCACTAATTGAAWRASMPSTTTSTATRGPVRSRAAAAVARCGCPTVRRWPTCGAACSARRRSAGWPTVGAASGAGTWLPSRR